MGKRKWQQFQEPIPFAFCAPSSSHSSVNPDMQGWGSLLGFFFFFFFSWRLKHSTGNQGGEKEQDSPWLQNRWRLSRRREALETSASGCAHNARGWQGAGLRRVMDLFPSPIPSPPSPFPCWAHRIPQSGLRLVATRSSLCRIPRVPSPSVGASPRQKATVEGAELASLCPGRIPAPNRPLARHGRHKHTHTHTRMDGSQAGKKGQQRLGLLHPSAGGKGGCSGSCFGMAPEPGSAVPWVGFAT